MKRIIGIGETVFDIIFKNNQPQAAVPGGSTFNSMISLGRTAAKHGKAEVLMISETGSDQVGDIMAHLQSSVFKLSKDLIDSIHEEGIVAYTS